MPQLNGSTVFERQQQLLDKTNQNFTDLITMINNLQIDSGILDEPLVTGLIQPENPLYPTLSKLTLRTALLFLIGTNASEVIKDAIIGIVNISGLAGPSNSDIIKAIDEIDIGVLEPIIGY